MSAVAGTESVRLAELAASLSLATDIGLGVALEHAQRSALMTVALADAAGFDADDARDAFYVALLKTVGCTGDEDFGVRALGEDSGNWIAHMAGGSPAEFMGALIRNVGRSDAFPRRVGKVLHALRKGPGMPSRAHCEVGRLLAERLGLSAARGARDDPGVRTLGRARAPRRPQGRGDRSRRAARAARVGRAGGPAAVRDRRDGRADPAARGRRLRSEAGRGLLASREDIVRGAGGDVGARRAGRGRAGRAAAPDGRRARRRDRDRRPVRRHEVSLHARSFGGRRGARGARGGAAGAGGGDRGPSGRAPARHRARRRRARHLGQAGPADGGGARARAHAQLLHGADPRRASIRSARSRRWRRWRTSGSTAPATTGGCPRRAFRRARASSPPRTRTTR